MSIEKKIASLLTKSGVLPATEKNTELNEAEQMGAGSVKKDTSITAKVAGDKTSDMQGSSKKADFEVRHEDDPNQGAAVSKSITKNTLTNSGPGAAPNFTTVANTESVVNMPNSKGNVQKESIDVEAQLSALLGESVSAEFVTKASELFESIVVDRVAQELESTRAELVAENEAALNSLVEDFEKFTDYLTAKWLEENQLEIVNGTKLEIMESFVEGLKTVFEENYITMPEEKLDVVESVVARADELEAKLDESTQAIIQLQSEVVAERKARILVENQLGLSAIDADKLAKLAEAIESETIESFESQLVALKENVISKKPTQKVDAETSLIESVQTGTPNSSRTGSLIEAAARNLSRAAKTHKV